MAPGKSFGISRDFQTKGGAVRDMRAALAKKADAKLSRAPLVLGCLTVVGVGAGGFYLFTSSPWAAAVTRLLR